MSGHTIDLSRNKTTRHIDLSFEKFFWSAADALLCICANSGGLDRPFLRPQGRGAMSSAVETYGHYLRIAKVGEGEYSAFSVLRLMGGRLDGLGGSFDGLIGSTGSMGTASGDFAPFGGVLWLSN